VLVTPDTTPKALNRGRNPALYEISDKNSEKRRSSIEARYEAFRPVTEAILERDSRGRREGRGEAMQVAFASPRESPRTLAIRERSASSLCDEYDALTRMSKAATDSKLVVDDGDDDDDDDGDGRIPLRQCISFPRRGKSDRTRLSDENLEGYLVPIKYVMPSPSDSSEAHHMQTSSTTHPDSSSENSIARAPLPQADEAQTSPKGEVRSDKELKLVDRLLIKCCLLPLTQALDAVAMVLRRTTAENQEPAEQLEAGRN